MLAQGMPAALGVFELALALPHGGHKLALVDSLLAIFLPFAQKARTMPLVPMVMPGITWHFGSLAKSWMVENMD